MTTIPLYVTASVTLNGSGAGSAFLYPGQAGETWHITGITVTTTQASGTSTNVPTVLLYRGTVQPGATVGGTFSGVFDSASADFVLQTNEVLWAVWSGADPNQTGTIRVEGEDIFTGNRHVG